MRLAVDVDGISLDRPIPDINKLCEGVGEEVDPRIQDARIHEPCFVAAPDHVAVFAPDDRADHVLPLRPAFDEHRLHAVAVVALRVAVLPLRLLVQRDEPQRGDQLADAILVPVVEILDRAERTSFTSLRAGRGDVNRCIERLRLPERVGVGG